MKNLEKMPALIADAVALVNSYPKVPLTVDCVIFGFEDNVLKVLLIRSDLAAFAGKWSLLGDVVRGDEELDEAAYRVLHQRTGLRDVFLEQMQAFSHPARHPGGRVITLAYCSLINVQHHALHITEHELHWHPAGQVGDDMAFDHKQILECGLRWLQKRIQEHPLGFNLLPEKFSLRELQNLYEAIWDVTLDRRNFRKKLFSMDFLIDTGEVEADVKHRPGKLYRFDYKKWEEQQKSWTGIDF